MIEGLVALRVAFKVTSFAENIDPFETHALRFLRHVALDAISWVNITPGKLKFVSLK